MVAGGVGGGGGGGTTPPEIPDTGELYGDLYVILRDEDGVPVYDSNGCLQPISTMDGLVTIGIFGGGTLTIQAFEGEPFSLAFYTDTAGDLVECELTEEMATWVETVDFGRLNLGRAPDSVIAHAFDEAINKMNSATEMYLDPAGRLVLTLVDEVTGDFVDKTIDAPAENLALYKAMMTDGDWYTEDTTPIVKGGLPTGKGPPEGDGPSAEPRPVLSDSAIGHLADLGFEHLGVANDGVIEAADLNNPELLLAASLLAAAADKSGTITLDKVIYINFIYGINQDGTLPDGTTEGRTYFDFGAFSYSRGPTYGGRSSGDCDAGWVWVLQPELDTSGSEILNHFVTQCMEILGYENSGHNTAINAVRFTDMVEDYTTAPNYPFDTNVRAFAQAADDALQVIEYIHNYKVPEVLYPAP